MRNMFYKYDNNIKDQNFEHHIPPYEDTQLSDCNCVEYLFNIKHELIGIKAKQNSIFKLYFNFESNDCSELLDTLTSSNIILDILNFKYDKVATFQAILDKDFLEVELLIDTSESILKAGNYKLNLYYLDNNSDIKHNLYNKTDFILSIE